MKKRLIYTDEMARHIWENTADKAVKAVCSNAIYRKDMAARTEVLRLFSKLTSSPNRA